MPKLHWRYRQQTSGVIQSAITCAIATAIACPSTLSASELFFFGFKSWLVAWITIVPFVLLATPLIRRLTSFVVEDETEEQWLDAADKDNQTSPVIARSDRA